VIAVGLAICALLLIPQAFVTNAWQLVFLRFLMGLALGGLLPCIAAIIRHNAPDSVAGAMLGYSTSSQYAGQVVGPLAGGFIGGHFGMQAVFIATSVLMAAGSAYVWASRPRRSP
jgi:MFS family permease